VMKRPSRIFLDPVIWSPFAPLFILRPGTSVSQGEGRTHPYRSPFRLVSHKCIYKRARRLWLGWVQFPRKFKKETSAGSRETLEQLGFWGCFWQLHGHGERESQRCPFPTAPGFALKPDL